VNNYWNNIHTVNADFFDGTPSAVMDMAETGPVVIVDCDGNVVLKICIPHFDDEDI
jgi:hypothetical protein